MGLFHWLRLLAKNFWCYSGFGDSLIEYCKDCGVRQPMVWTADNTLWSEVTGCKCESEMAGVLCPTCFDKRATALGIGLRWVPVIEYRIEV